MSPTIFKRDTDITTLDCVKIIYYLFYSTYKFDHYKLHKTPQTEYEQVIHMRHILNFIYTKYFFTLITGLYTCFSIKFDLTYTLMNLMFYLVTKHILKLYNRFSVYVWPMRIVQL